MEAKEIAEIVDSMFEDELDVLSQLLALSEPERPDEMILRESGLPFCPGCGCVLPKNGTDGKGHQKWICGGCEKTVSSSTSWPTARTRLSAGGGNGFRHVQIKGIAGHCNEDGETMNEAIGLMLEDRPGSRGSGESFRSICRDMLAAFCSKKLCLTQRRLWTAPAQNRRGY